MKKNWMFLYAFMLMPLVVINSSCSDDDGKSKTELLTRRSWLMTKAEIKSDLGTVDISASYIEDCEKDNLTTFSRDGRLWSSTGADDCDGHEEYVTGTWSWTDNETVLVITIDGNPESGKLLELTESTLKFNAESTAYDTNGDGIVDSDVNMIFTFISN